MYAWPLRPAGLKWLGLMIFAAGVIDYLGRPSAILALLLGAAWWMMAFKLASEALTRAADGRDEDLGYEVFAADSVAFGQMLLGLVLFLAGMVLRKVAPTWVFVAFWIAMAVMLPAAVMLVVREDSIVRVLDPRLWRELMSRIGGDYLSIAAQIAALAIAVVAAIRVTTGLLQEGPAEALAHGLILYLLLVAYHGLGELLHRNREALELPDVPAPSRRLVAATPEETAAVDEAERLLAADQPKEAAASLDRLIRGRGATAPVHKRYRELLAQLGDEAGLVAHARGHVAVLLHQQQRREALALYLDAKQRDPEFELGDPQPVSDLIAIAAENQQAQLGVALYEEFARRFPNDRDLAMNGLAAAKLMDRLDRDQQARTVLRELIRRFPEHPLREQLDQALAAIGPNRY
jgi:tetratricopeptide (TPR) repeat protein